MTPYCLLHMKWKNRPPLRPSLICARYCPQIVHKEIFNLLLRLKKEITIVTGKYFEPFSENKIFEALDLGFEFPCLLHRIFETSKGILKDAFNRCKR